jgi:hypothetical protein
MTCGTPPRLLGKLVVTPPGLARRRCRGRGVTTNVAGDDDSGHALSLPPMDGWPRSSWPVRPGHPRIGRHLMFIAAVTALGACGGGERETLLELDVVMPAHPIASLAIDVGESEHRMAQPATFPPAGQVLGIDLLLPHVLAGKQEVALVARDARGCHVAIAAAEVEIVPGEKVGPQSLTLEELAQPVCDANGPTDAGANDDTGVPDANDDTAEEGDVATDMLPDPADRADAASPGPDDAAPVGDAAAVDDAKPPVDAALPPPVPHCDAAGHCGAGLNCIAGNVCAGATSCGQIKTQKPGAADGVYWVKVGATDQQVYCDLRIGAILCSTVRGEHAGKTRIGPEVPFKLSSELDVGAGTCRIWAVRHAVDGYPFDKINPPRPAPARRWGSSPATAASSSAPRSTAAAPTARTRRPTPTVASGGPTTALAGGASTSGATPARRARRSSRRPGISSRGPSSPATSTGT